MEIVISLELESLQTFHGPSFFRLALFCTWKRTWYVSHQTTSARREAGSSRQSVQVGIHMAELRF
jgi:hypothetical protein